MKLIKTVFAAAAASALMLAGCSKYSSSYDAVGFVHNNTSDSAFMDFYKFDGTMVFTLDPDKGSRLVYSGKLETGSAEIFYDANGSKEKLFTLETGNEISSELLQLGEDTLYIIVETKGGCENGSLEFEVK